MQNYYYVLGVSPTATAPEIERAYQYQRARLQRLATADPAMRTRLAEVEAGYSILGHPRRRVAYDQLRAQEPDEPARLARPADERLLHLARWARRLNVALLACYLALVFDWALPPRRYAPETVLSRLVVDVSSSLADPQLAYRVRTEHTYFRLLGALGYRVRENQVITVWQTPLFGVVQRVSSPASPDGSEPFRPYEGTIYTMFFALPLLLLGVTAVGAYPNRTPETYVNTAAVGSTLGLLVLVVLLWL